MRTFLIKFKKWEYWSFAVLYFPVFFYYLWLSLKRGSLFFFNASNPKIEFGGMFGEKKSDIFKLIPNQFIPETYRISKRDMNKTMQVSEKLGFPLIAKPDVGERGVWVQKLHSKQELIGYLEHCPENFLLQELVNLPIELGVFYVRLPEDKKGCVTSIVRKRFLSVIGDGTSSIKELLTQNMRAQLMANLSSRFLLRIGNTIPEEGEEVVIESIGNHCRGTQFLNDNHEIDEALSSAIDKLAQQIPEFYFGRFDLRCRSYEDLKQLKHFKILELNGAGAEPGHIYQPGYALIKAYKDIFWHLKVLSDISAQNKKRGFQYSSFSEGIRKWKAHRHYVSQLNA